jgi:hypothetical protein
MILNKISFFCLLLPAIFFSACLLPATAQKLEFGIGGGVNNYKGDIAPGFYPAFSRPGFSVFFRHNVSRAVSFKYSFMGGSIFADDTQSNDDFAKIRGYQFTTSLREFAAAFEYNFLDYRDPASRKLGTPYLHLGVGVFRFTPKENLNPDYPTWQLALPFGVGYRRIIAYQWNIGLEFGARKTFTDNLDDLGSQQNGKFQSGNPNGNDMYFYTQLMVSYTLYKVQCPKFGR